MFFTQHRRSLLTLSLAASLGTLACAPQAPPPDPAAEAAAAKAAADAARTAIDDLRAKYVAAENSGDAAALAALYTDEGVYMPSDMPAAKGPAAIQAAYEQMFGQMSFQGTATPASVEVAGEWVFEQGSYKSTMTPKDKGKPMEEVGKYVVVARNTGTGWKVQYLIWNSDSPPMAPK